MPSVAKSKPWGVFGGNNMEQMNLILHAEVDGLDRLLVDDPSFRKHINGLVKKLLRVARSKVSKDARGNMQSDPRQAYRAVKHTVYKNLIGGNVSILSKRKASNKKAQFVGRRKIDENPHQRGGNRVKRVDDARNRLSGYWGSDRGFALRFIQGTTQRTSRYGNRASIIGRTWFETSSIFHLQEVADMFGEGVGEYIDKLNLKK